jgi:epsilon-lactone hydrolase
MASPQAERIKVELAAAVEAMFGGPDPDLAKMRVDYDRLGLAAPLPGVEVSPVDAGGVPAYWVDAAGGARDRVLLYLHGGGYVLGSAGGYNDFCGHLATAIGCRVLNVDYRLAPEHPHPAPVEDSVAAYRWLLDQGITPAHLAVAGDSAGGGLTLSTLLKLRDDGLPQPAGAVPLSPWVDMEALGATMASNAGKDVMVNEAAIKGMAEMFLMGQEARDPLAAPLYGDYRGICPMLVQVGADETLLDDAIRVADTARAAGVDVTLEIFAEMQHVFQLSAGNMPEADDAVAQIGVYLRPRLGL